MRHTRSHTRNRRSHHALSGINIVTDKDSSALRLPHTLDESTGMYRGMQIVSKREVKAVEKKEKGKAKAKREEQVHGENTNAPAAKHDRKNEDREKQSQGLLGRMITGKAKSRSGFGGGA
jgi:ribosomal protein L32